MAQTLPPPLLEKLESLLSPEEFAAVNALIETPQNVHEPKEETPAETYERLEREYSHLHGIEITSKEAEEEFGLKQGTLYNWLSKRRIRTIRRGRGQGVQTSFDKGDVIVLVEFNKVHRPNNGGTLKGNWNPPARW